MTYIAPEDCVIGVGFLERLEADAKPVSYTRGPEAIDVFNSIKRNISNILNTRLGGALSAPDLGLIDFNDATLETLDLSLRIKIAIQDCLNRYEPRLANVSIHADTDPDYPLMLRFSITAFINSERMHKKVKFSLLLDQNRKYRVF